MFFLTQPLWGQQLLGVSRSSPCLSCLWQGRRNKNIRTEICNKYVKGTWSRFRDETFLARMYWNPLNHPPQFFTKWLAPRSNKKNQGLQSWLSNPPPSSFQQDDEWQTPTRTPQQKRHTQNTFLTPPRVWNLPTLNHQKTDLRALKFDTFAGSRYLSLSQWTRK